MTHAYDVQQIYEDKLLLMLNKLIGAYDPNIVWNEEFKNVTKRRLKVLINDHNVKYTDSKMYKEVR